ncbi:S-adenosyl-L-methionine-dependent methyltransferase [Phaeosphaeria sp. MPI-PUGE-AT-0046c]|nr:S-adenosyl-L-methionine-dependent methyltransferase [Phaeosphaeria sp. MPI-PUGE-AT-0046c]
MSSSGNFAQDAKHLWQDAGMAERYANAENATRPSCQFLVAKSGLANLSDGVKVFDLATGTGAAVQEIYDAVPKEKWGKVSILGGDVSEPMLAYLKARGEKEGWQGLETKHLDGNTLDLPSQTYTHVFCTFAVFVIPDVLPKLFSTLKPGGFAGISTWASLPWVPLLSASISQMPSAPYNPTATEVVNLLYSGRDWGSPQYVSSQLESAGFSSVSNEVIKKRASVGNADLFMESMQFPLMMVKNFWPEEKREELLKELNQKMRGEVDKMVCEDGRVEMEFEGICAWGWKE